MTLHLNWIKKIAIINTTTQFANRLLSS